MYLGDTELLPGERVLWEGAPKRVPVVEKTDLIIVPGLVFIGFWYYLGSQHEGASSLVLYVPMAIVLIWIAQGVNRYLKKRASTYLVTDRRVVVWTRGKPSTARYLSDLGPPQVEEHDEGIGTITFGGSKGFFESLPTKGVTRDSDTLPELIGIVDARRVRDLIATAQYPPR